jgi:hypothetical protein
MDSDYLFGIFMDSDYLFGIFVHVEGYSRNV